MLILLSNNTDTKCPLEDREKGKWKKKGEVREGKGREREEG